MSADVYQGIPPHVLPSPIRPLQHHGEIFRPKLLHALNPITALHILCVPSDDGSIDSRPTTFILAGEGPLLKVFDSNRCLVLQQRIFRAQSIHGLSTILHHDERDTVEVLVWGGFHARTLALRVGSAEGLEVKSISDEPEVGRDWILDGTWWPYEPPDGEPWSDLGGYPMRAVVITAHNELYSLSCTSFAEDWQWRALWGSTEASDEQQGGKSILYSAHVQVESGSEVVIAAGTVFGEIIVWSYAIGDLEAGKGRVMRVFKGHEGSVFGVQLSPRVDVGGEMWRLLASCSDDRTVRVWDVSPTSAHSHDSHKNTRSTIGQTSTSATGFGAVESDDDRDAPDNDCVAKAWGHTSRIWRVKWLPQEFISTGRSGVELFSFGEDATYQQWRLQYEHLPSSRPTWDLKPIRTTSVHTGKNIWSADVSNSFTRENPLIVTGGADGRIVSMTAPSMEDEPSAGWLSQSWSLDDIYKRSERLLGPTSYQSMDDSTTQTTAVDDQITVVINDSESPSASEIIGQVEPLTSKSVSKRQEVPKPIVDGFRNVSLLSANEIMASAGTTCSIGTLSDRDPGQEWKTFDGIPDLRSCSAVLSAQSRNVTFLATTTGSIYYYCQGADVLGVLLINQAKIGGLLLDEGQEGDDTLHLLAGHLSTPTATIIEVKVSSLHHHSPSTASSTIHLPKGFIPTAICTSVSSKSLIIGSRTGSLAVYHSFSPSAPTFDGSLYAASHFLSVHGDDAITSILSLVNAGQDVNICHILTTGRDGRYCIHALRRSPSDPLIDNAVNFTPSSIIIKTIHSSTPPFGPMIEGAQIALSGDIILHGFRSKQFVVWNETKQIEIMSVECGGAHRRWSYHSELREIRIGGRVGYSFAWLKASRLYYHRQYACRSSQIIQAGGHGREIKTVAIAPRVQLRQGRPDDSVRILIATGAEDTAIRFSAYAAQEDGDDGRDIDVGDLKHQAIVKDHTTGIQHLQWSRCGRWLFSSGGVEEFFVWRVRHIKGHGIGVTREGICPVIDGGEGDLRILSFTVTEISAETEEAALALKAESENGYEDEDMAWLITMVFSDSTIRTYIYSSSTTSFRLLLTGTYATSCLLHAQHHISSCSNRLYLLTAGTDGYLVIWHLTTALESHGIVVRNDHLHRIKQLDDILSLNQPAYILHSTSTKLHQSAIKSLASVSLLPQSSCSLSTPSHTVDKLLVCSGGDDNALIATTVSFTITELGGDPVVEFQTKKMIDAHAAAITSLAILPSQIETDSTKSAAHDFHTVIITASNDQRLKTWDITVAMPASSPIARLDTNRGQIEISRRANVPSSIADVACIAVATAAAAPHLSPIANTCTDEDLRDDWDGRVVVAGVGLEVWDCPSR